jgi:hypothetical protein
VRMFLRSVSYNIKASGINSTAKLSHVHIRFEGKWYGHVADERALWRSILIVCENESPFRRYKR